MKERTSESQAFLLFFQSDLKENIESQLYTLQVSATIFELPAKWNIVISSILSNVIMISVHCGVHCSVSGLLL